MKGTSKLQRMLSKPNIPTDCTLKCGRQEWCLPTSLVCDASVVLQQLLKNIVVEKDFNHKLVLSINFTEPDIFSSVVEFIKSSQLKLVSTFFSTFKPAEKLKRCAELYILADNLQMPALRQLALEEFEAAGNSCFFSSLDAFATKDLVQYAYTHTGEHDTDLRPATIKLAAFYHQKYLRVYDSVLTSKKVQKTCSATLYQSLFHYQGHFPELDSLLNSLAPHAWQLAQDYEQQLQEQDVLYAE